MIKMEKEESKYSSIKIHHVPVEVKDRFFNFCSKYSVKQPLTGLILLLDTYELSKKLIELDKKVEGE